MVRLWNPGDASARVLCGTARDTGTLDDLVDKYGVWIVRTPEDIEQHASGFYSLSVTCTHLGCTPNYLSAENKFKCPCHGSGFRTTGVNFEGPAPRPLERVVSTRRLRAQPDRCRR